MVQIDVVTGDIISRLTFSSDIHDVTLAGDHFYVYTVNALYVVLNDNGLMSVVGSLALAGSANGSIGRMRFFVGSDTAYTVHRAGYSTIDVSNPTQPTLITYQMTTQFGWKDISINGSGIENCNIKCPKEDIVKQECSMPKSSRFENSTEDKKRRKTWNKSRVVFIPEKASI
ncbi:MAG: hypothetical protein GKR87_02365 [Kiritimatiellae bacterium]|nr:hypothetical protein [Kiritimatiellia bacterium]